MKNHINTCIFYLNHIVKKNLSYINKRASIQKVLFIFLSILFYNSCSQKNKIDGRWRIATVEMWDSYQSQKIFYDVVNDTILIKPYDSSLHLTRKRKDSILSIAREDHLVLNKDRTFELKDNGFFKQALSEVEWHGDKSGLWNIDSKERILTLSQPNGLEKQFLIKSIKKEKLVIKELYGKHPISEIVLIH